MDPDSTENLKKNREKLSEDITDLINEYGPKTFDDFDPNNVFRHDPSGNRKSVSELAEGGHTFRQLAQGLLDNTNAALDWLDDRNIFNLTKQEEEEAEAEDVLHFYGSASEAESSRSSDGSRQKKRNGVSPMTTFKKD